MIKEAEPVLQKLDGAECLRPAGWWRGTKRQAEGEFVHAEITGAVFR